MGCAASVTQSSAKAPAKAPPKAPAKAPAEPAKAPAEAPAEPRRVLCDVGIIGAGVMGSNLALNIAEKGFRVALYNRTFSKTTAFIQAQSPELQDRLVGFSSMEEFAGGLAVPRKALVLVPAGPATDAVIEQLVGAFSNNDIVVDTGNAHFRDQSRRAAELESKGLRFLGMGISGGEEGARKGPAFFPGGSLSVWDDIRPIVEAAAAKAPDGRPCVTMNGKGGAGTCVKMFHNAGEYAILQVWGELFDVLRAAGRSNDEVAAILADLKTRQDGFLESYMLDITIEAARARDGDGYLTDKVLDKIGSKGTGLWSAQEALGAGVPCPSLSAAVISRQFTMCKDERLKNAAVFDASSASTFALTAADIDALFAATKLSIIVCYAQMFQALRVLDQEHGFGLNLPATIATFRAGCILQGKLLEPMTAAFERDPGLPNLLDAFRPELAGGLAAYRRVCGKVTAETSVATPVLSASLVYINGMMQGTLRYGQLVSLQRDVFGRHGFERLDREGKHNHDWPQLQ